MAQSDDEQSLVLNFGSDLSIKACIGNCMEGECCDCDHHRQQSDTSAGQRSPASYQQYQQPTAHQSLLSIASSGRGPSQPRSIAQQYQSAQSMYYGSPSNAGRGQSGHYYGSPASQGGYYQGPGGVFIAPQYPSGFTTQNSSYPEGAEVTPFQQSMGWYRDGAHCLHNGQGQPITEQGQVIQPAPSSMPQSSPASGFSYGSFQTAPSHQSGSGGGGSYAGSHHGSGHRESKHKRH